MTTTPQEPQPDPEIVPSSDPPPIEPDVPTGPPSDPMSPTGVAA